MEEAINVKKLTAKGCPLVFESSGKNRNFLIDFYCLKRNKSDVKIQKEEVDKIYWVKKEQCFELMKSGRTKFPNNYNYEPIFTKMEEIYSKKEEKDISK